MKATASRTVRPPVRYTQDEFTGAVKVAMKGWDKDERLTGAMSILAGTFERELDHMTPEGDLA